MNLAPSVLVGDELSFDRELQVHGVQKKDQILASRFEEAMDWAQGK